MKAGVEGEDEQPCMGTPLAAEAAAGMRAPIPAHAKEKMPLITKKWGDMRRKKQYIFLDQPPVEAKKSLP